MEQLSTKFNLFIKQIIEKVLLNLFIILKWNKILIMNIINKIIIKIRISNKIINLNKILIHNLEYLINKIKKNLIMILNLMNNLMK